ncbi:hypothetical protein CSOJ01_11421 [Colletotrichum sojae]|uniref:Uncharacterized protein n=1 Tax=Colletotrichum sojae TaxID=2175907 RepID=A0A8H6MMX2_9PEZI|nr:hypothetical protein CSOJ01_11421 [Colletotrichum sojae]
MHPAESGEIRPQRATGMRTWAQEETASLAEDGGQTPTAGQSACRARFRILAAGWRPGGQRCAWARHSVAPTVSFGVWCVCV